MHVDIDPGRCNGNATCVLSVPDVFDLTDDGSLALVLLDPVDEEHRSAVEDMVVACPTQAISIRPADR
jgi:ferredoxin